MDKESDIEFESREHSNAVETPSTVSPTTPSTDSELADLKSEIEAGSGSNEDSTDNK